MEREAPIAVVLTKGEIEQEERFNTAQANKASEAEILRRRANDPEIRRLEEKLKERDLPSGVRKITLAKIETRAKQLEQEPDVEIIDDEDEGDNDVAEAAK